MADVVNFPESEPTEPVIWYCQCGCFTHYVRVDGELECAQCGSLADGAGAWKMPVEANNEKPDSKNSITPDPVEVVRLDTPEGAMRWVLSRQKPEDVSALILIGENGRVSTWGDDFSTEDQKKWLREMIETAYNRLLMVSENGT